MSSTRRATKTKASCSHHESGHENTGRRVAAVSPKTINMVASNQATAALPRPSPLKQVSPILKKYSPVCLRKTGGNLKKSPRAAARPRTLFRKMAKTDKIADNTAATSDVPTQKDVATVHSGEPNSERIKETASFIPFVGSDPDSEIEMVDDALDIADNEDDLTALMIASTTINTSPKHVRQHMIRKRKKSGHEQDDLLALLAPEPLEVGAVKVEKSAIFAHAYLQKAMDVLGGEDAKLFNEFLHLLHHFHRDKNKGNDVVQLYKDVCSLLKDFPHLCEDFLVFLLPEQAIECDRFTEYLRITKMQNFLRKLEVHFGKHPLHMHKIIKLMQHLQQQDNLTMTQLMDTMIPLLRGQTYLVEEFLQLFPEEAPPLRHMQDFEEVVLPDDNDVIIENDDFEVIKLPEMEDPFGMKDCPCFCHVNSDKGNDQHRLRHCVCCGIKFIDGRIFLQSGKILKPCRVVYHDDDDHEELVKEEVKDTPVI